MRFKKNQAVYRLKGNFEVHNVRMKKGKFFYHLQCVPHYQLPRVEAENINSLLPEYYSYYYDHTSNTTFLHFDSAPKRGGTMIIAGEQRTWREL